MEHTYEQAEGEGERIFGWFEDGDGYLCIGFTVL